MEERHRPTFRRLLGYIHLTAKEQSTEDSLYSLLPHLHPHSCSTDCFQQPLRMCCGGVWGAGVCVCTWDTNHTGTLPVRARKLGCSLRCLYSWGIRCQSRPQETAEANSPQLQGQDVWKLALTTQQFPPHFFWALIKILMRVARIVRKQTVWKANMTWEECIKAKSCTDNQSLRQQYCLHRVWAE